VAAAVQKFIDFIYKKKKDTPETADWYFKHLKPFVESVGNLSIPELQTHHIQEWIDSHDQWSNGTKHGAWRAVNRAFRWAVKQGHMMRNPAEDVEKEPPPRREIVVPETDYRKILELTKDGEFRDLISVAWECGARAQELLPMEIRHLELERGRAIFPTDEAKGKQRPRYVYFTDEALAIVKRRVSRRKKGRVFLNTDAKPWTPFSVACRFARLKKKLKVRYCLTNFRHTWQTRLLQSGIDAITVAHLAGHNGDPSMLAKVYFHLDPSTSVARLGGPLERLRLPMWRMGRRPFRPPPSSSKVRLDIIRIEPDRPSEFNAGDDLTRIRVHPLTGHARENGDLFHIQKFLDHCVLNSVGLRGS
jgi:integrase